MPKAKLKVEPKDDRFVVENEAGDVLLTTDTEQEADHLMEEMDEDDDLGDGATVTPEELAKEKSAGDDSEMLGKVVAGPGPTTEPVSEHNPHGLNIHERFARLLVTLKKGGIHHSEDAHPLQNAQTAPGNFAK